ncbi:FAD-binding protein [Glutamicibacter sp. FR1]|uniref:FAD-binding protein n=1 Tax=Glutamicibacter sp. FR1 TaxID=3393744 RepID=UPI0039B0CC7D
MDSASEDEKLDALIIGWGKGGKTLAGTLARAGQRVAIIEQSSQMYGGHLHQYRLRPHQSADP